MKRFRILGIIPLCLSTLFLGGCEFGNIGFTTSQNDTTISDKDGPNEIVGKFATIIGKRNNDFIQENIQWLNHENIYSGNYISGFLIETTGKKEKEMPNTDDFFDGWHREYVGDGMRSSQIEYRKGNIVCYYYYGLEQEVPYEIVNREGDYDSEEYNQIRNNFFENATYEIKLECGTTPEGALNYEDMYFDGFGFEPSWNASIRGNNLTIITPEGIDGEYYFNEFKKDGNSIQFGGYDNQSIITKKECIDAGKGDHHDYFLQIEIMGDFIFTGCADKFDTNFIIGEQGTTKTFNKKSGLKLKAGNENYYEIMYMAGNYMFVSLGEYIGEEYIRSQLLLEHKDNKWNILYEGDYDISDEKCEELNQYDHNLMDMAFLQNCPRG